MRPIVYIALAIAFPAITSYAADFALADKEEALAAPKGGSGFTLVAKRNMKGQTFNLTERVDLEGLILRTSEVTSVADLTVQILRFARGMPTGEALYSYTGQLPATLRSGDTVKLTFDRRTTLPAGSYAFILSTDNSKLKFNLGNVYDDGRLIRSNATTRGKWATGGSGKSTDLIFRLVGLPMPAATAQDATTPPTSAEQQQWDLVLHKNPVFKPADLNRLNRQPNIITVMIDDLGWNQIGVGRATFGTHAEVYNTPNLARLANEGLCFTNAYAQPNCAPTRAAMLSGQYPARIHNDVYVVGSLNRHGRGGVSKEKAKFIGPAQSEDVATEAVTVAAALQENGYRTAHIGKYHVGGHDGPETLPENVGFNINIGGYTQGHQPVCFANQLKSGGWEFRGLGRGDFDRFAKPYSAAYLSRHQFPASLAGTPKHISDAVADAMEETVASFSADDKPFYLQVHPYAVHGPVQSRPDLKDSSDGDAFVGFVKSVDLIIGRLLKAVEDPNGDGDTRDSIAEHTLVLFTSDNGGTHKTNLPLKGTKGMFTEGGIRVPLIAWWPGQIPAKTVTNRLVHTVDYYPTYLDLAGLKWTPSPDTHPLDGSSFADFLVNPNLKHNRGPIFYLFPGYLDRRAQPCLTAIEQINNTQYKLIYFYESGSWELYNITEDISEIENIVTKHPEIVSHLAGSLRSWLTQDHPTWKPKYPIVKKTGKPAGPPSQ
ncbi:MAG: sulfatase-like hydrolase/transferase [Rubripirellula sp.]|nr:sulfatase-like hydrolase/transferase [Rubripirellula sp.]